MPVLTASGAGVRHRRRWLFRDLDLTVEPGEIVALTGPPGSGRTTLLLALAGRFRLSAGKVTAGGVVALGHVPGVAEPEPVFTVAEHVRERLALLGRPRRDAEGADLRGLDPRALGRDLTPYQKQVLGLVLAGLGGPAVIALDGFGDGLDARERAGLWTLLTEITAGGTAVLFTGREADPADVSTLISLGGATTGNGVPPGGDGALTGVTAVPARGAGGASAEDVSERVDGGSAEDVSERVDGGSAEDVSEGVDGGSEREDAPDGMDGGSAADVSEGMGGGSAADVPERVDGGAERVDAVDGLAGGSERGVGDDVAEVLRAGGGGAPEGGGDRSGRGRGEGGAAEGGSGARGVPAGEAAAGDLPEEETGAEGAADDETVGSR